MRKERIEVFNEIIQLVLNNSNVGIEAVYNEYGKFIKAVAKRYCNTEEQVNVVCNSVLIKIWSKAKKLNNVKNPEGLIFTITRNCAKDEMNKRWHNQLNENICSGKDYFDDVETQDSFFYLISDCSEIEQEIYSLRFIQGLSFQEIAECVNKPLPTITSIYYRALRKIEKTIKKNKRFE